MPDSAQLSRTQYAELGPDGLAGRTTPQRDAQTVAAVEELLAGHQSVLDLGCGYGRISLPLSRAGHVVHGLDVSPNLIAAAHTAAKDDGLGIGWAIGSMTDLPYRSGSFDAVICLWTAFHELCREEEQLRAVKEIARVLKPGGLALIEGPVWPPATAKEVAQGIRQGPERRLATTECFGTTSRHYVHDALSYSRLCKAAGIEDFRVYKRDWGGRRRLLLEISQPLSE